MSCRLCITPKESASSVRVESKCWKERDVEPGVGASASRTPGAFACDLASALAAQPDHIDGATGRWMGLVVKRVRGSGVMLERYGRSGKRIGKEWDACV